MDTARFWDRTNTLIKERGYTQRSLAMECGFTARRIESLSSDNRLPATDETVSIAAALGVSVEYLVTGAEHGKPDMTDAILNDMQAVIDHYRQT